VRRESVLDVSATVPPSRYRRDFGEPSKIFEAATIHPSPHRAILPPRGHKSKFLKMMTPPGFGNDRAGRTSPFQDEAGKVWNRRILVIAGCSGEGRLTTPKPDGAEIKTFDKFICAGRSNGYVCRKI
jgi:hypothetical protein